MSSSESEYETIIKDEVFSDFEYNEIDSVSEHDSDQEDSEHDELELDLDLDVTKQNNLEIYKSKSNLDKNNSQYEIPNLTDVKLEDESKKNFDIEKNLTPKYLFKFEYVKIISKRVAEIRNIENISLLEAKQLAKKELREGKLNYTIKRTLPNGKSIYYNVNDLYIKKN